MRVSQLKVAWILFGAMTALTFLGPPAIFLVFRGGGHQGWPPENPTEWAVLIGVASAGALVFVACLAVALALPKRPPGPKS